MNPHRSTIRRVGLPPWAGGKGQVTLWLSQSDGGPTWLNVNVAHGASATVQLPVADGDGLRDGLGVLLRAAGNE
jgi:hypothetical protein